MNKNVLIVESPTKAKTISKYLGSNFEVIASSGHIRQMEAKSGSVDTERDFAIKWTITKSKYLTKIKQAVSGAKSIILATDPDREGEAVAWHILECLKLEPQSVQRITFNAINKDAVMQALKKPRTLDLDLVDAYLARASLDYMVGFGISPVLWRKLIAARSAGRVQSVALRIICEREDQIDKFVSTDYFKIKCALDLDSKEIDANVKFESTSREEAEAALNKIPDNLTITDVKVKAITKHPHPPFITSTLQQEASKALGFNSSRTMQVAQSLYEPCKLKDGSMAGLITYMRTDSTIIDKSFQAKLIGYIDNKYPDFKHPRCYNKKIKNSQEAHECIRPSELIHPSELIDLLTGDQLKLYTLIWNRTLASQIRPCIIHTLIATTDVSIISITCSKVYDIGFEILNPNKSESEFELELKAGKPLIVLNKQVTQHATVPPKRYSESALINSLEEKGIGRPSTYAYIINILKQRNYATVFKKNLRPSEIGRVLITYLKQFFGKYLEYDFTSNLEYDLDRIAEGRVKKNYVLKQFWSEFKPSIEKALEFKLQDVACQLEAKLVPKPVKCSVCKSSMHIKMSKNGIFLGCSNYPTCTNTQSCFKSQDFNPVIFESSTDILQIKNGQYGYYLELKNATEQKRASIFKWIDMSELDKEDSMFILNRTHTVCNDLELICSKYGIYVSNSKHIALLPKKDIKWAFGLTTTQLQYIIKTKGKPKKK